MPPTLDDVQWTYRSGAHRGLQFNFAVRSDDRDLGLHVETLLRSLRSDQPESLDWYSLLTSRSEVLHLYFNDVHLAQVATEGEAIEWLLWDINRSTAAASDDSLLLHAGAVQASEGAIVFPAASGGGTSTLVAGLVRLGFGYLSDEIVALSLDPTSVQPYPKPITLKPGSYHLFPELEQGAKDRFFGQERSLPPDDIRPGAIGKPCEPWVFFVPRFVPEAGTDLSPLSATDAFLSLTLNSVNLEHHGDRGTKLLALLAERCRCYELVMSDLATACEVVMQLVEV
jgi:hypothetical protein